MKSLIMATLLTISSTASAMMPLEPPTKYQVMGEASELAIRIKDLCQESGSFMITFMENGERVTYIIGCTVTKLGE